ncbi:hypothetical protein M426DRAFT_23898 [Hypoxylon sp. CI-4A]|nr:hypothetical protein M426DRAFT_23898 [Hypoxylon sp. CI-4A]
MPMPDMYLLYLLYWKRLYFLQRRTVISCVQYSVPSFRCTAFSGIPPDSGEHRRTTITLHPAIESRIYRISFSASLTTLSRGEYLMRICELKHVHLTRWHYTTSNELNLSDNIEPNALPSNRFRIWPDSTTLSQPPIEEDAGIQRYSEKDNVCNIFVHDFKQFPARIVVAGIVDNTRQCKSHFPMLHL